MLRCVRPKSKNANPRMEQVSRSLFPAYESSGCELQGWHNFLQESVIEQHFFACDVRLHVFIWRVNNQILAEASFKKLV